MAMKKEWVKPLAVVEQFVANEYVAACSDTENVYYKFVCDAGGGDWADIYEGEYPKGTNLTPDEWFSTGYFHACNATHFVKAEEQSPFTEGWYDGNYGDGKYYKFDVIIWKGENDDDVHATKALKTEIETIKGNRS